MTSFERYRSMLAELAHVRFRNGGFESPEEDDLLDRMDEVWTAMSQPERSTAERLPAVLTYSRPARGARVLVDRQPSHAELGGGHRLYQEVA